jgi:hypothetical protein
VKELLAALDFHSYLYPSPWIHLIAAAAAFAALGGGRSDRLRGWLASRRGIGAMRAACAALGALFVFQVLRYWFTDFFHDHVEAMIASVSWLFAEGRPVYHPLSGPQQYSPYYGPLLFMIPGAAAKVLGPAMASVKAPAALSALAGLGVTAHAILRRFGRGIALPILAVHLLWLLGFGWSAHWIRSEPFLYLLSSLAVATLVVPRPRTAAILLALALGLSADFKFYAVIFALPALAQFALERGWMPAAGVAAGAAVLAGLPYLAPNVSLASHLEWLGFVASRERDSIALEMNLRTIAYIGLPLALLVLTKGPARTTGRAAYAFPAALALSCAAAVPAGSLLGGGVQHLIPLLPPLSYAAGLVFSWGIKKRHARLVAAIVLGALGAVLLRTFHYQQYVFQRNRYMSGFAPSVAEIRELIRREPGGTVAVGYGVDIHLDLSGYRAIPVFEGQPYDFDEVVVMDAKLGGHPLPREIAQGLRGCRPTTWLIPKGAAPFDLRSYYPPFPAVFDDEFKEAFRESYERSGELTYFEVWRCRRR